jgi:hypothetical protein
MQPQSHPTQFFFNGLFFCNFEIMRLSLIVVLGMIMLHVAQSQPNCLNCINGVCTLEGKCECNAGFIRRDSNCIVDDGSTTAAGQILDGLDDAILFGLIAGGVLLIVIMLVCCVYFMRSSLNDAPVPTAASYRDNAILAQNRSIAGANSGATFGGGNIFGGAFVPAAAANDSSAAAFAPMGNSLSMATFNPATERSGTVRAGTVRANAAGTVRANASGTVRNASGTVRQAAGDDDLRESVHTGFAFPGALGDDDDELVKSEDMLPGASSPAMYAEPKKKKKPVHTCSECGAEYYWEADLAAHRKKRHNIVD